MQTGKVKWFEAGKNYGFITPTDGDKDVFVHISGVEDGTPLEKDQMVEFDTEQAKKGIQACKVRVIG